MALEARINQWLTQPTPNAVGRLGLYRILFALFYLAAVATDYVLGVTLIPVGEWRPVIILGWLASPPPDAVMHAATYGLLIALGLLLLGWRTPWSTLAVMALGTWIALVRYSYGKIDHEDTFMTVYIPLVMMFSAWGETYSLDARRRKKQALHPNESSWRYGWPMLVILWLLSIMYMMSGYIKIIPGVWLEDFQNVAKLMVSYNAVPDAFFLNPIIATNPLLYVPAQLIGLAFETLFPLALINMTWRRFFLSMAVFFHLFNHIFLHINFAYMFLVYALFVDWQAVYEQLRLERLKILAQVPASILLGAVIVFAVGWHTLEMWRIVPAWVLTLWLPWVMALPLATYGLLTSTWALVRGLIPRKSTTDTGGGQFAQ